ncbi:HEAT repeat-containing protein 6 [Stigmatopora nigra]
MATSGGSPASPAPRYTPIFSSFPLSADAAPFTPQGAEMWQRGARQQTDAERLFHRCAAKLRDLQADSGQLREELNLLFDQLISENFNQNLNPNINIQPEDVCILLVNASRLVPMSQEHLVVKLSTLVHHLLNQFKVIMDEQTLHVLLKYLSAALDLCNTWTHLGVLQALATVVYGNGPQCQQHLDKLLGEGGVIFLYSAPSQPDMDLRHVALTCMANICIRISGQPLLDEKHKKICFSVFLQTLQATRPDNSDELFYCIVIQTALKGLHSCLLGGKWKFGGGEVVGSVLAVLKRLMFQGIPGVSTDWPVVLYPAPLLHYESPLVCKPDDEPPRPVEPQRPSANKKRKSRGKVKKAGTDDGGRDDDADCETVVLTPQKTESAAKPSAVSLYPSWKRNTSDSDFSDPEGSAQNKLRLSHARVRQGALHCLLAVVKWVERRTLYGYWSSFIPETPVGNGIAPPLTLLTIILKDPSPKVRACALQALSGMLDGARQFLAVAEDTASPRTSYTPFSFTLATAVRELHRSLSLALVAETSPHTLTHVIKCLAHLVSNAPYHRLRPGLLSSLWKQIRPYVRHRDANVRVSALTLYGALVTTQAPLPEVQLLLQQPESSADGSLTPQGSRTLNWRQRGERSSPQTPRTPKEAEGGPPWLLTLCSSLVTQPRDEPSDSEGGGGLGLEPSPVRLEALQVISLLVRGYISLTQSCLCDIGHLSARCLAESDPSIQLHGAKLLEELGTGIIQQYQAESKVPEVMRVPVKQVVQFWTEVLSGPLNGALQKHQHPTLQTTACDTLGSILPQAFAQLPEKTQLMCITVLLGLTYSDSDLVKMAAVRALGVYVLFPCLREDLMFVADTANVILATLGDRSSNIRAKATWSLGNLTDTLLVNMNCAEVDFQEEMSDMLLLKMLQAATRAAADKDKVKCNAVRALGNLLHFLRGGQLSCAVFRQPLEDAVRALVKTVQSVATMKVRWNACYALGNAFRNPDLPLESATWSGEAFSALCNVVETCKNFKVRIKSAAALAVPAHRRCYGDTERFAGVWRSLAAALHCSEDTQDFLEYRYSASLRLTLSRALLHLLRLSRPPDLPAISASLAAEEAGGVRGHLLKYLRAEEWQGEEKDAAGGDAFNPQQRIQSLKETVEQLKMMESETDEEESGKARLIHVLEDLVKDCKEH